LAQVGALQGHSLMEGSAGQYRGTIKAWSESLDSGLIRPDGVDDGVLDVVVTRSALVGAATLTEGATVKFDAQWSEPLQKFEATACVVTGGPGDMPASDPAPPTSVSPSDLVNAALAAVGQNQGGDWSGGYWPAAEASDNLFIAGLPKHIDDASVQKVFGAYGNIVRCKVLPDQGYPDRVALVQMEDINRAKWMVDNLHNNIPVGLNTAITVRYKHSRPGTRGANVGAERLPSVGGGYGAVASGTGLLAIQGARSEPYGERFGTSSGGIHGLNVRTATHSNAEGNKVWVGNIPPYTSKDQLKKEFEPYGVVEDVYIRDDGRPNSGKMFGFITFAEAAGASACLLAYEGCGSV